MNIWILAFIILAIAVFMTMTGHGGGIFFFIALLMIKPVKKDVQSQLSKKGWINWHIQSVYKTRTYPVNLLFVIPIIWYERKDGM